jgi:aminoglycoside phosphotransferase (APT) family kinase protein
MNLETVNQLLAVHGLTSVRELKKFEVGFSNDVYLAGEKYIVKVCTDLRNSGPFKREAKLYEYFETILPVPELVIFDDSLTLLANPYMIYKKVAGENLYNVWHQLSSVQRQNVVRTLCGLLKSINNTNLSDLPDGTEIEQLTNWKEKITSTIETYLAKAAQMQTLTGAEIKSVQQFIDRNAVVLDEQRMALVYWDVHFDNVLVEGDTITGLLDFERTEYASIDFVLDTVKRMVDFPKKYMSQYAEQFAKAEDYSDLLEWYKEFYPELFAFENLEKRLALYSIAHDLKDLSEWPNVEELKQNILKTVET